ncbi:MAG: hypothetical protein NT135_01240 [Candidatus Berkelbacteria bacterium]|nr:hypothetical protein [Candidatus Berkelbacteria bacterium]
MNETLTPIETKEPNKEQIIDAMRGVFGKLLEKDYARGYILGFLVFGSRMAGKKAQPYRLIGEDIILGSDIDVIPVTKTNNPAKKVALEVCFDSDANRALQSQKNPDFDLIEINHGHHGSFAVSTEALERDLEQGHFSHIPFWAKEPEAVYYIGTLPGMTEEEVNEKIKACASEIRLAA